jgi:hypothetical protein
MKHFISFIKRILSNEIPRPIGRWKIEQCNKKMNHKVDLSNEDHCGPCGQYALEKIKLIDNNKKMTYLEKGKQEFEIRKL